MLKKKNIAMVMAAATVATSVAPVFAAVTTAKDMADATQKKEVMDQVKKALDTTYTTDKTKLKDEDKAGKSAFTVEVVMTLATGVAQGKKVFNSYDVFAAYMDKMSKGDTAQIKIIDNGHRLAGSDIVDWDNYTFQAVLDQYKVANSGATLETFAQARLEKGLEDNIVKFGDVKLTKDNVKMALADADGTINISGTCVGLQEIYDVNDSKDIDAKALLTFKSTDTMVDFGKPIRTTSGAIIGFEESREDIIKKDNSVTIDVKCTKDEVSNTQKTVLKASDLVEEGRLTLKGNELLKRLEAQKDEKLTNKDGKAIDLFASADVDGNIGDLVYAREEVKSTGSSNIGMYKVAMPSKAEIVDAKTSKVKYTVTADLGYAYKNGYKLTNKAATAIGKNTALTTANVDFKANVLEEITVEGTHEEIKQLLNQEVKTVAGEDRYKTSVEVSKKAFTNSTDVVLVGGEVLADGLTATPLASQKGAPILLTQAGKLNADTKAEIERLGSKNVTIVGGTSSVSEAVASELRAMGVKVERVYGQDRFETSLEVAKRITTVNTVYVAEGNAMADALSISAVAGEKKQPILLTAKNSMSKDVAKFIEDKNVNAYVIGGSVSKEVSNNLDKITKSSKVLAGADRYDTNAKVLAEFGATVKEVMLVNGDKGLVDALAAGAYAGKDTNNQALVLVGDDLTGAQKLEIKEQKSNIVTKSQVGYGVSLKAVKTLVDLLK